MEKWIGKIEMIVQKVDAFTKKRVVAALLMAYEGVMLLMRPRMAARGMAQGICIGVALAAVGFLSDAIPKKQIRTCVLSGIALVASVYFYFFPDGMAMYLRYVMALVILAAGLMHLLQAARMNRLLRLNDSAVRALREAARKTSLTETVEKTFEEQMDRRLQSTLRLFDRLNRGRITAWVSAVGMTAVGVFLLIYPVEGNAAVSLICGLSLMIAAGVSLWAEFRARE